MISCRRARALLVDHARGPVPEGALLQLDLHLVECAACQQERAQVATLASLRDWTPPGLGAAARARIVATLASRPREATAMRPQRARPRRAWTLALAAGAAAAAAIVVAVRHHRATVPAAAIARHEWDRAGTLRFGDAELRYAAGTRVELDAAARTIRLGGGELEVGDSGAPVRVVSGKRIVVVSGRAMFAGEQIRVYSGEIVVFDDAMHPLATVAAGQSWPPATAPTGTAPTAAPSTAARATSTATAATSTAAPATSTAAPSAPVARAHASAADLAADLDRARAALAAGDAADARRFARRALAAASTSQQRAEAELFLAESYLVEHQPDRAITVYRQIALSFPRSPEGEAAAFAAAQVLYERGRVDEARAALRAYVTRYPDGRFAREATDRLSALAE